MSELYKASDGFEYDMDSAVFKAGMEFQVMALVNTYGDIFISHDEVVRDIKENEKEN